MDSVSEARLSLVHPVLADAIRRMAQVLDLEGIYIRVTQGMRSCAEQDQLYAQGRSLPGKIVTNCPGGKSWHNFGLAVDLVPSEGTMDAQFLPDWNENHPDWKRMIAVGESLGLTCGADWRTFKDYPHFQLTGKFPAGSPNDAAIRAFHNGGISGVWEAAEIPA